MSAESIAKALGGRRCRDSWLCRCPGAIHARGDRNPSLLLKDGERALLIKCFAGCSPSELLGIFRERGLIRDGEASQEAASWRPKPYVPEHRPDPEAVSMWQGALALHGTLAAHYLGSRGLAPPYPAALRLLPQTRRGFPAMVAAIQAPDSTPIAVQLTYLDPAGRGKARITPQRMTFGELGFGAVRLAPAAEEMGIAEGTETALAAAQLTGLPVWAALGGQRMHRVAIPSWVRRLHIFGDNDEAGRVAADRTAHAHGHRHVTLRFPPNGVNDYADLLLERLAA